MSVFRVWAPTAQRMRVQVVPPGAEVRELEMWRGADGWWGAESPVADHGVDYGYLIDDDEQPLPDPRSRWQPHGVHGLSRIYDPHRYRWRDRGWTGRDLPGSVIYELHIGTFTPGGTFDSAVERLDHLVELGITHVEVLPINAVNGVQNWGYDGVDWYAVHEPYGGPDGFKRFVDACHERHLAVVLDVVYNHLGASGNYLPRFGPYFKPGRNTWGDMINLDGADSEAVRRFIVDNALMWLSEFHVDALRLDAVHALSDSSETHILAQLAEEVEALCAHVGRPLLLIAESDLNDDVMVRPESLGGYGLDAQWDDDVHHALHALLTGERAGYYGDFGAIEVLAYVATNVFWHDGKYSSFRGRDHGRPVTKSAVPAYRFVTFLQDHDQIGNRAQGDRLPAIVDDRTLRLGALLLFALPFTPMLFMGEEWGAGTPWQFFTSHPEPDLGRAVAEGRKAEFADHGWAGDVPDPQDPQTYERSKLDWSELDADRHAALFDFYRKLIAVRHEESDLTEPRLQRIFADYDEAERRLVLRRGKLRIVVNLADEDRTLAVDSPVVGVLIASQGGFRYGRDGVFLRARSAAIVRVLDKARA